MTESLHTVAEAADDQVRGGYLLPAPMADELYELMMQASGPAGRAIVVQAVVDELRALVEWIEPASGNGASEAASIDEVPAVVRAHLQRMRAVAAPSSSECGLTTQAHHIPDATKQDQ